MFRGGLLYNDTYCKPLGIVKLQETNKKNLTQVSPNKNEFMISILRCLKHFSLNIY